MVNYDIMSIYTRTGDDGTTGLIGRERVRKSDPRIECYGTVDELNAAIGWAAVVGHESLVSALRRIQHELFNIGAHLAAPGPVPSNVQLPELDETMISRLEMEIDAAEQQLAPLRNFVLPGGTEPAARLHLARTVCRRAERLIVGFSLDRPVAPLIIAYLNRVSDWLFVQARLANQLAGMPDIPWEKK